MKRDRTRRRVAAVVVGALVLAAVVAPAAGATPASIAGTAVDPDAVLLRVDLRADGSAAWTVEYRIKLDDENATAAFESLRSDVRANRTRFVDRFADRMRRTVRSAENATGREMALRNVTATATTTQIPQPTGVITYTFVWEGFATTDGPRVRAGDAIRGLFLDEETTFIVAWSADHRLVTRGPAPDETRDHAVVWHGPLDFATGEPLIVISSRPAPADTPTRSETDPGTTARTRVPATDVAPTASVASPPPSGPGAGEGDGPAEGRTLSFGVVAAGAALLALVGAAGWMAVRRRNGTPAPAGAGAPSEDLLSNEERVLRLLDERGGRMKQGEVADALDWTDAKTSQVVGDLREAGEVDGFRLGRENVLTLPDEEDT